MSKMVRKGLTKRTIAGLTAFGLAVTCFGINAEMPSLFDLGSDTRVIPVSDNTVLTPENTGSAGGEEQDNGTSIDNSQKDNNLLTEDAVDYKGIIEESKDEEFRQIAEISKDTVVVAREETDASESIESEVWFGNQFADYRVLMEKDNGDSKTVYYEIETTDDVWDTVDELNELDSVLIAEPVYIYHTMNDGMPSAVNNPSMSSQWYLQDQEVESIWGNELYGDTSGEGTVVAVIDTGVDYKHEDLKDNIWMNSAELFGQDGVDDDGNGYVDDIYGYSFVSNTPDPMDDNGHGTHVAGIIAMADNNTGGVGIAYKSKIMSIKAGQADGSLSSTDIAKAINYASSNGADVINMSFG